MELINDTLDRFRRLYGEDPEIIVAAPGRVNLIGEHTDYNNGYVLPIALDRKMIVAGSRTDGTVLNLYSVDLQALVSAPLSKLEYDDQNLWANYPKGVADCLLKSGRNVGSANVCMRGNVPIAAGLSSSAALEVTSAILFNHLNDFHIAPLELISLAHCAETQFVGVQCGIMDQFISMMGEKGHALFLDCKTLEFEHIPFPKGVQVVICDTGLRRELARTAYNMRNAECEEAVRILRTPYPDIKSLRDVTIEQLSPHAHEMRTAIYKRAVHVVTENARVLKSVAAMKANDLKELGYLMVQSHESLRVNYEVSCRELDVFVDIAMGTSGVYGARMTGAGFGGCGICLVDEQNVDDLVERLKTDYPRQAGHSLTIYLTSPADGAEVYVPKESHSPISFARHLR